MSVVTLLLSWLSSSERARFIVLAVRSDRAAAGLTKIRQPENQEKLSALSEDSEHSEIPSIPSIPEDSDALLLLRKFSCVLILLLAVVVRHETHRC